MPDVNPSQPASHWPLSSEGRLRSLLLAVRLDEYQPMQIATSSEPKAIATAEIVSDRLGLPFEIVEGLHEHDRSNVLFLSAGEFESAVGAFFERPDELVLGRETARDAQSRFAEAVGRVINGREGGNVVIVSHGTVIALYLAQHTEVEPLPLWRRLGLPSFVVSSLPSLDLLEIVKSV